MSKTVDVLLTEHMLKLGNMGDIVSVKPGYARNYLLPQGKGVLADKVAKRQVEALQERAAKMESANRSQAEAQARKLTGLVLKISAKVSHDTHLFGSVGVREVVDHLAELGYSIGTQQVHMAESCKELGVYQVPIRLYRDVETTITVEVIDSDPQSKGLQEVLDEAGVEHENAAGPAATGDDDEG